MYLLIITQLVTGLGAGFFFAWNVTVIPGTKIVSDATFLELMQWVNKKIINPVFFVIFFGPGVLLTLNATSLDLISAIAALIYIVGAIGITMVKNGPLNDKLEARDLSKMSDSDKAEFRKSYEPEWNRWHYIRTVFSVIAFALVLMTSK